ncbi:LamG-like jellyroll fold domain-containing protein [uncultured Ramlibacter sp.]|uniref:LamG-like jellyroll fold domain-containing protein n=1 Tax=uncultured Ramlibacter sp. TaxID=260755 RepID=UPI00262629BF|nr:LamG-like jellyroll fold domain-containing protein [uncultured Ramlibacter sp.]
MNRTVLGVALLAAAFLVGCGGGDPAAETAMAGEAPQSAVAPSTYWAGVNRALPVSPHGNTIAVSCHNCYGDTVAETNAEVAIALARGFDLVEMDLTLHSNGQVYVEHNDSELAHGTLAATLANASLQASDRMLFLEVKEAYSTAALSDTMMLAVLRAVRDGGYAAAGRPVFLRAFMDGRHNHLVRAKAILAGSEFAGIRSQVRFHTLIQSDIRNNIRATKTLGLHGVELEYRMANLYGALMQARLLGLGVGVYTAPASMGELYLSAMREDMDFITTDYDRGASAAASSARALIQEATALAYVNTAQQTGYPVNYKRTNTTDHTVASSGTTPAFEQLAVGSDEDRVGGSMVFAGAQSLTTYDADNAAAGGFLVTAVVNFDDLTSGATAAIVAKSDSGGFALEQAGTLLRFGVQVNGAYTYATAPLSGFDGTSSYFIVGAYDGNGAVRLWVNNVEKTASASISGGVTANNSPVVIGADPQGATDRRYFFKGKVQQVMVQKWRDH